MPDLIKQPMKTPLYLGMLAALALLSACASTPQADKPTLELPAAQAPTEDLAKWWVRYNDPALDALVERALANNADLRIAAARVEESAAALRVARSGYAPSVDLAADASRSKATEKGAVARPAGTYLSNDFKVGIDVAYEVDLWGRVRSANRAALGDFAATREALATAQSSIAAQVARSYFSLLAIDHKLDFLQQTLVTRNEALQLALRRLNGGTANNLQVQQAQSERDAIAAAVPTLKASQAQAERAIALLVGASPREIIEGKVSRSTAATLPDAPAVPEGLPSSLLMRRPDVRQAEATLAASQARVSEARAQYFPQIILTGGAGYESAQLSDLFSPQAFIWRLAAGLTQPIFGLNRIDAQVNAAKARSTQAEVGYVRTVQTAFKEAYDALGNLRAARETQVAQTQRATALVESLRIAQKRYDVGASPWLEVLDAQRNLYSVESDRIDAQANALTASVDIFRALGGGW
ncbi:efflux transporter outer membrane subunit [Viridibacterium curvum]|uniref:Efflux transporter outer membrane subunit n=1 Tax=Viridibacterium curvum TaxID=1101404 RepID=A0ABP9QVF7_9RHOO